MEATIHFNRYAEIKQHIDVITSQALKVARNNVHLAASDAVILDYKYMGFKAVPCKLFDRFTPQQLEEFLDTNTIANDNELDMDQFMLHNNKFLWAMTDFKNIRSFRTTVLASIQLAIDLKLSSVQLNDQDLCVLDKCRKLIK